MFFLRPRGTAINTYPNVLPDKRSQPPHFFVLPSPQVDVATTVGASADSGLQGSGGYLYLDLNATSACANIATLECIKTNGKQQ